MNVSTSITIEVTDEEANAIVRTVVHELCTEGEQLMNLNPYAASPGTLSQFRTHSIRVAQLHDINDQLSYRAHWGPHGGSAPAVTADRSVFLDLAACLWQRALDQADDPTYSDNEVFGDASQTLTAALGAREAVVSA